MAASGFEDHFSSVATDYALYRPQYPEALFEWLFSVVNGRRLAWDCATGNGQAAVSLARGFVRVVASDASAAQVAAAQPADRVEYAVFPAEQTPFATASVNLITVAQALHWFHHRRFNEEARRVLVPGGVIAAWTYQLFRVCPEIDPSVHAWYHEALAPYWPAGRRHVDVGYTTIPFPFEPVAAPPFQLKAHWTLHQLRGYLGTWSAVKRYQDEKQRDARALLEPALSQAWGDPAVPREITWDMPLLVGRR